MGEHQADMNLSQPEPERNTPRIHWNSPFESTVDDSLLQSATLYRLMAELAFDNIWMAKSPF